MEKSEHLPRNPGKRAPWAANGLCNVGMEGGHRELQQQKPWKRMGPGKVLGMWMDRKGCVSEAVSERHLQKACSKGQILSRDWVRVKVMILTRAAEKSKAQKTWRWNQSLFRLIVTAFHYRFQPGMPLERPPTANKWSKWKRGNLLRWAVSCPCFGEYLFIPKKGAGMWSPVRKEKGANSLILSLLLGSESN